MTTTSLSLTDVAALSPLLFLLIGALAVLLVETFAEKAANILSFPISALFILIAIIAAVYAPISDNALLTPWLSFDPLSRLFTFFFLAIGLASACLAHAFFHRFKATQGEYYFLLLSALFGLLLIGSSADFLTLFLGLELLSIALYVLCGYMKKWNISHEASMKYFLMGALAAAFLLYGIALIYGATGTTRFDRLLSGYQAIQSTQKSALFLGGIALVTLGLAFKAAIVPFHVWAPDVYDGASTPVTAFMAVGTKVGAFAAFARVFLVALPQFNPLWSEVVAFLAIPTLIYANYVALRQTQLRRFFAYSGISHAGFLLIPLAAGTPDALSALMFYLAVYAFATLGCFAVLAFLDDRPAGVMLKDLQGLFKRAPLLAGVLALCMLTLAGIPPTIGFFAKFYLFKVAFQAGYYWLVIIALLTTILAAYYYLRMIAIMFSPAVDAATAPQRRYWTAALVGIVSCAAIIVLSLYPAPFMAFFVVR
ncbi:MAG: NADH-quinone oxidoreductase subunit N [Parachlamydiaceae bacterium]|nr:NADH-quinone oxidoreductase subunit N [Parachlamydiaceae bacterium]